MNVFRFGGPWFKQFMPKSAPYGDFKPGEIRDLIFLWAIQQEPEGLTGYTISSYFGIPLTNVYRILDKFVNAENPLLETSRSLSKDGRAQKKYKITEEGNTYLLNLQEEWAGKISFLAHEVQRGFCAPPFPFRKRHHPHFDKQIKKIKTQNDAFLFLKVYQESFEDRIQSMEDTIKILKDAKKMIDDKAKTVHEQDDFTAENFVKIVSDIYEEIEATVRKSLHKHGSPPPLH